MNAPTTFLSNKPMQWWRLNLMALPLAFVTLPMYVLLPHRYATEWQVSLVALGWVLLCVRALDALSDPWLGQWCDRCFAQGTRRVLQWVGGLSVLLGLGFVCLWLPDRVLWMLQLTSDSQHVLVLAAVCLVFTYLSATSLNLCHQSWGTRLGGDTLQQSHIVAWREGFALLGVVLASVLSSWLTPTEFVLFLCVCLFAGYLSWYWAASPPTVYSANTPMGMPEVNRLLPWQRPAFRALIQIFMLNGIASAIPATLVMFFIQDRIQTPHVSATSFLAIYFISAAFSFPLWLAVVKRLRLTLTWLIGMALSVAVFIWAVTLREGDALAYAFVCAATGVALGADLVVPGTLLTGVIQRAGDAQQSEGRYLGWWQVASKLNLALAAGVGLPALSWLGYTVGTRDENALLALTWIYAGLPCLLKLLAALLLYRSQSFIEPLQPSGSPA